MNPVFPSILSTSFFDLEAKLQAFAAAGIDFIHLDVMDGHFVDQISFGPSLARAIRSRFSFRLDAHLMVANPEKAAPHFMAAGVDWISFHAEAAGPEAARALLGRIRGGGCRAGLVLNPDTPLDAVRPFLAELDYVLLMSVFAGYGGQSFIPATLERAAQLKREIAAAGCACLLQVDGGINPDNAARLKEAGADLFVVGTALFQAGDVAGKIRQFHDRLQWSRT